jgi:hypothetical protein
VSGAVFAVFCIFAAHPMFAVAAPLMGSGRQALGDWRRKDADEARRRRSHGGQTNREAEGADQSWQKAAHFSPPLLHWDLVLLATEAPGKGSMGYRFRRNDEK